MRPPEGTMWLGLLLLGCEGSQAPVVGEAAPQSPLRLEMLHGEPGEADLRRALDRLSLDMSALAQDDGSRRDPTSAEREAWEKELDEWRKEPQPAPLPPKSATVWVTSPSDIVADRTALVALGKAFFWEMRAGSDGQTACATCHHSGGADGRAIAYQGPRQNAYDAWLRGSAGVASRRMAPDAVLGPNLDLEPSIDRRAVNPSVGLMEQVNLDIYVARGQQNRLTEVDEKDWETVVETQRASEVQIGCEPNGNAVERQVTCKNAPTVYASTLFESLFHDGRTGSTFYGYDRSEYSNQDPIGVFRVVNGKVERVQLRIPASAAAAQATMPLLNAVEMSWANRTRIHLARKLYDSPALKKQTVDSRDPVLGPLKGTGGLPTYREMIQRAFRPEWTSTAATEVDDFTVVESNFLVFWGLAVEAYEATLVPDKSPFDQYLSGIAHRQAGATPGFGEQERAGFQVFIEHGCIDCHALPETSIATRNHVVGPLADFGEAGDAWVPDDPERSTPNEFQDWLKGGMPRLDRRVETMNVPPLLGAPTLSGEVPLRRHIVRYNSGYYNIGAATECENPGQGAGFFVNKASSARNAHDNPPTFPWRGALDRPEGAITFADIPDCNIRNQRKSRPAPTTPAEWELGETWIMGAYKTPMLRNLPFTAPYFTPAKLITTQQMGTPASAPAVPTAFVNVRSAVEAYVVFPSSSSPHLHPSVRALLEEGNRLLPDDIDHLTTFLLSLTDPRVGTGQGVFCTPSILLPTVLATDENGVTPATDLDMVGPSCTP